MFLSKVREQEGQGVDGTGGSRNKGKRTIHFYKPTVEKFDDGEDAKYYLVAGELFSLTGELKQLTDEEIADLPVIISWKGPNVKFEMDEKECFRLLTEIIFDMNKMQDPRFVSFPVGECKVLFLYKIVFIPAPKSIPHPLGQGV